MKNRNFFILSIVILISVSTLIGCNKKEDNNVDTNTEEITQVTNNTILSSDFVPNGEYTLSFNCSDLESDQFFIKGNGETYQVIGANGKGPFVNVYRIINGSLNKILDRDLTIEEFENKESLDFLSIENPDSYSLELGTELAVESIFNNKVVVETGNNLSLDSLQLQGKYIIVEEKEGEFINKYYYSEGLGLVAKYALMDDIVMSYYTLTNFN